MNMKCHCKEKCIKFKSDTLENINQLYLSCKYCSKSTLKKAIPLKKQVNFEDIDEKYGLCDKCNKRHIDFVMAHILKILMENNLQNNLASIRKVGTPLISPGVYLDSLPYLTENSLVIIIKDITKQVAEEIYQAVPQVKAVLKGDINNIVGIIDNKSPVHNYELLAGCDVRCDIQNTDIQPIIIYKQQSKVHIEYPKAESEKIVSLNNILKNYENPTILDAMCGPGTLGMYALLKNSKKVVFNDINEDVIDNLKINLEINEIDSEKYEIYNEDIFDLVDCIASKFDIGIIDAFPGIDTKKYEEELEKICEEIIVI